MNELPRYWRPRSEADIQRAISDGLLAETHYLDCKREVGATSGDRKETGRDMASFALDGGGLVVGVAEDQAKRAFTLAPQPLAGLSERVENLAGAIIDPPLDVIPHEIPSGRGEGLGYLLVEVRPSPFAPHMVDGVYYGRGEKKRVRLTDPQVLRYHAQRRSVEEQTLRLLDEEIARDIVPVETRWRGHLYLVARPLTAPRAVARSLVRAPDPRQLQEIARSGEPRMTSSNLAQFPPPVAEANQVRPRAHGMALCSRSASGPGRTFITTNRGAEDHLVDIEFREDGSIRALVGNATYAYRESMDRADLQVNEPVIVVYAVRLTAWAAALSRTVGYHGSWSLGLHASGLRDLSGFIADRAPSETPRFDDEDYREVTTASLADLEDRWSVVVGELVGRLLYALATPMQAFGPLVKA